MRAAATTSAHIKMKLIRRPTGRTPWSKKRFTAMHSKRISLKILGTADILLLVYGDDSRADLQSSMQGSVMRACVGSLPRSVEIAPVHPFEDRLGAKLRLKTPLPIEEPLVVETEDAPQDQVYVRVMCSCCRASRVLVGF